MFRFWYIFLLSITLVISLVSVSFTLLYLHGADLLEDLPQWTVTWEADPWVAGAKRVYFDECDFNSVLVAHTFTYTNIRSDEEIENRLGTVIWRGGFRTGVQEREVDISSLRVRMTQLFDKDWNQLQKHFSPRAFARLRNGAKPYTNVRFSCSDDPKCESEAGLNPAVRDLFTVSREVSMLSETMENFILNSARPYTRLHIHSRPHVLSVLLWLEPHSDAALDRASEIYKDCVLDAQNHTRERGFYAEVLSVQPLSFSLVSLEYSWDGKVCTILFAIWVGVRAVAERDRSFLNRRACDLYCLAYLLGILAWVGLRCYVASGPLGVVRLCSKSCSIGADLSLIAGTVVARSYRSPSTIDQERRMREVKSCRRVVPQFGLLSTLLIAAALPAMQAQVPPGFFLCADGGDPCRSTDGSDISLQRMRLLPLLLAMPFATVLICDRRKSKVPCGDVLAALAFVSAPAVSALVVVIFAAYVQRKVQLLAAVVLRTIGAFGLVVDCGAADSNAVEHVDCSNEIEGVKEGSELARKRWRGTLICLHDHWQILFAILVALISFLTSLWLAEAVTATPSRIHLGGSNAKAWKLIDSAMPKSHNSANSMQLSDSCFPLREKASNIQPVRCHKADLQYDSATALHVIFACDFQQIPGLQASIASIITSANSPSYLFFHVVVAARQLHGFAKRFGLPPNCTDTLLPAGARLEIVGVDRAAMERSVAAISTDLLRDRGALDSMENYVRFSLHALFPHIEVAIYLDADTIVNTDLRPLRDKLLFRRKTIGFAVRHPKLQMKQLLNNWSICGSSTSSWKNGVLDHEAYNVGVFVVNLWRWSQRRLTERIEALIELHNKCEGRLWVGGSQPPLLLAFIDTSEETPRDFITFDAVWNTADLGWRENLSVENLVEKSVLHWNGKKKPWRQDGLYKELWQPHCDNFIDVLRKPPTTTSVPPDKEALIAQARCPYVELLDEWSHGGNATCKLGQTFGCAPGNQRHMWASGGCEGIFGVDGRVTWCGRRPGLPDDAEDRCAVRTAAKPTVEVAAVEESQHVCAPETMPAPQISCDVMLLTSYFTMKRDWQRLRKVKPTFAKIRTLYQSSFRRGLNVTMIYDELPEHLTRKYASSRFTFERVWLEDFNRRLGLNDVRYFFFDKLIRQHPEWKFIFVVDGFDVHVSRNPCYGVKEETLYVGSEKEKLKGHPWMARRFDKMGGNYSEWYKQVNGSLNILNCGLIGGGRSKVLELFQHMMRVIADPNTTAWKQNDMINLNMAALNYIVYNMFPVFSTSAPFHSRYKMYETGRQDVWFIHK